MNAMDVLFVYRLLAVRDFSAISLAKVLLENGIAFKTLLPLKDVESTGSLDDNFTLVPIRLSGYRFKPSDYEAYICQCAHILTSPRGLTALLRGGLIARIAREHLGLDSAALGPSSSVTVHRMGLSIVRQDGSKYWDDELTQIEVEVICGLHRCFTGSGLQVSLVSWWPMPHAWANITACGYNWGHWTEWDEHWYLNRLQHIADSTPEGIPFSASEWRNKLRGAPSARALNKNYSNVCTKLFAS